MDAITTHFDLNMAQPPQACSYASILTAGSKSPAEPKACPSLQFDLILVQANHACPALTDLSNDDLAEKIDEALMDTGCFFKTKPCILGSDRNDGLE